MQDYFFTSRTTHEVVKAEHLCDIVVSFPINTQKVIALIPNNVERD